MSQEEARYRRRRELYSQRMAAETPEARLAAAKARRDAETPEAREARLPARRATDRARRDVCRARAQSRRAEETPADRDHRLAADRDRSQSRRDRAREDQEESQSTNRSGMVEFHESISSLTTSTCETCLEIMILFKLIFL